MGARGFVTPGIVADGGAIAAAAGADFLCYVTASEHLSLPNVEDVREGIIAARIAAHAADISKGIKGAKDWDQEMALARKNLDWERQIELAIDKEKAQSVHSRYPTAGHTCSMCGQYCAVQLLEESLSTSKKVEDHGEVSRDSSIICPAAQS